MSLELSKENEKKWIEEDRKHIINLLDSYLVSKDKWKREWGKPSRYKLKEDYQKIAQELFYSLPDEFHHRGFVIKKGYNKYGVYLQVFTEESFARMKLYYKK